MTGIPQYQRVGKIRGGVLFKPLIHGPPLAELRRISFFDVGNVYRHLENFKPFDLRTSAGAGLRVHTPYAILRLDYGRASAAG